MRYSYHGGKSSERIIDAVENKWQTSMLNCKESHLISLERLNKI